MQRHEDYVADLRGNAKAGASVYVYAAGTTTPSTLYSDDGVTSAANPLTTDSRGMFYFYAADGLYDLLVTGEGFTDYTVEDVQLFDSADGVLAGDVLAGAVYLQAAAAPDPSLAQIALYNAFPGLHYVDGGGDVEYAVLSSSGSGADEAAHGLPVHNGTPATAAVGDFYYNLIEAKLYLCTSVTPSVSWATFTKD